jgi:integrase
MVLSFIALGKGRNNRERRKMSRNTNAKENNKRPYGTGSIREIAKGKFEIRLRVGKKTDGSWAWKKETIVGGKRMAEERLAALIAQKNTEEIQVEKMTVEQMINSWLVTCRIQRIHSFKTSETNAGYAKNHIYPIIGSVEVRDLTKTQVQTLVNTKTEEGLASATVKKIFNIIRSACIYTEVLKPIKNITINSHSHEERRAMTNQEVEQFLAVAQNSKYYILFLVDLLTGLRRSELLALTWDDIDFENNALYVRRKIRRVKNQGIQSTTKLKTKKSKRKIPFEKDLKDALLKHQVNQQKHINFVGNMYDTTKNLVFANDLGNFLDPDNLTERHLNPILEEIGIKEKIAFHIFRHTFATRLLRNKVPVKVVSQLLGHAEVTTTMLYQTVDDDDTIDAIATMLKKNPAFRLPELPDGNSEPETKIMLP